MLIIGHRGAAGVKPENTIASLRAGRDADVDMIEFDVRITKDNIPVLMHDKLLIRTHRVPNMLNRLTYAELAKKTKGSLNPILKLDSVLKEFGGQVMLCLDLKDKGSASKILPLIEPFIKSPEDWEQFIFFSTRVSELSTIRRHSKHAQLGLIHWQNALTFLFVNKKLNLTAAIFHRLNVNGFVIAAAKKLGLFTFCYTVNRPEAAVRLARMGVDGIITDVPHKMVQHFAKLK